MVSLLCELDTICVDKNINAGKKWQRKILRRTNGLLPTWTTARLVVALSVAITREKLNSSNSFTLHYSYIHQDVIKEVLKCPRHITQLSVSFAVTNNISFRCYSRNDESGLYDHPMTYNKQKHVTYCPPYIPNALIYRLEQLTAVCVVCGNYFWRNYCALANITKLFIIHHYNNGLDFYKCFYRNAC